MVTKLTPLKTLSEINASEQTVEALVVEIPIRLASRVLSILKPALPPSDSSSPLPHLRHLVTRQHLPAHLQASSGSVVHDVHTIFLLLPPPLLNTEGIIAALKPHITDAEHLPTILSTRIPLHPPISAAQAALWSQNNWPCTYNPASQTVQNAPPRHLLCKVQAELGTDFLNERMQLVESVAQEGPGWNIGRRVGAVIVDPVRQEVVAAAADARRWTPDLEHKDSEYWGASDGRPEHHALMRAIAMVAEKERWRRRSDGDTESQASGPKNELGGRPLTNTEKFYFTSGCSENPLRCFDQDYPPLPKQQSSSRPDTYLCSGLDVYLTHEPCVCCAMAMIHSRFRACVFAQRMPGTGGLCAETDNGGLGYGLFWRRELNWRVMTFELLSDRPNERSGGQDRAHGETMEAFHA